jgi:eukaryotic-like serine/threonine-protein kinase
MGRLLWYLQPVQAGVVLLERYELVARIGEGATSAVWEARDQQTGERVAVKAVSLDDAGWRAEVRDRFQREARLLALVRHEHLVGVRDVGETDDGYLFIVLDMLTGETLADRITRGPRIHWREAAGIALQIARGISALHARGIVHRDLKPANVFLHQASSLGEAPVAKIIDLGISKARAAAADKVAFATLTATGQVLGTPAYMSYEQALGERDIDARCDVWAVGVVLYEMLAGRRPFEAPNVNAVLAAIRKGAPVSLTDFAPATPAPLVAVVARCLEPMRDARFRDGSELAAALASATAEGELQATWLLRRRLLPLGIGAALLGAAGIGFLLVSAPPSDGVGAQGAAGSASAPASAAREVPAPEGSSASPSPSPSPSIAASQGPEEEEEEKEVTPKDAGPPASAAAPPRASSRPAPAASRNVTRVNDAGF